MPNRMCPHYRIPQGKRAFVRLKDGTRFVDKFRKLYRGRLYFDEHIIKKEDLQMMEIYRGQARTDSGENNA